MMRLRTLPLLLAAAVSVAGCSSSSPSPTPPPVDVTVYAAASLTGSLQEIADERRSAEPGMEVKLVFGGSADLVSQLSSGAPGDVLLTADTPTMDKAVAAGLVDRSTVRTFATNTLTIVTAPGNPLHISSLADLARPGVSVVVCAPQVPCGNATRKVTGAAGVTLTPVSEENSVTSVLGKVTSGQADAGIVYVTDAARAGKSVTAVDMPEAAAVVNEYQMGILIKAPRPDQARAFVEHMAGPRAQDTLTRHGFRLPG